MGVYHLMGLGRSPGTVIGALTYLAQRYQRWNAEDVRALVVFTAREVLCGRDHYKRQRRWALPDGRVRVTFRVGITPEMVGWLHYTMAVGWRWWSPFG